MTLIYSNLLEPSGKCQSIDLNTGVFEGPKYDHDAIFCNVPPLFAFLRLLMLKYIRANSRLRVAFFCLRSSDY